MDAYTIFYLQNSLVYEHLIFYYLLGIMNSTIMNVHYKFLCRYTAFLIFFKNGFIYLSFVLMFCLHVYLSIMHVTDAHKSQKVALDSLELVL